MAKHNSTENPTPISCEERNTLALEATWEIEHLASLVMELAEREHDMLPFRGLGARIKELNSVVMSAVGEETRENSDLYRAIYKKPYPETGQAA